MTQEFVTLPREVVEQALEALINEGEFRKLLEPLIEKSIDSIRAALERPQNHVEQHLGMVPAGWKLVPVEPTDDMLYDIQEFSHILPPRGKRIWAHMLAAAPQPPTTEDSSVVRPQVEQPAMTPIAQRKLYSLLTEGYTISGYSVYHEQKHQHGFVTGAGLVGWWKPDGVEYPQPRGEQDPVAWMVTSEMQDGTRSTYPMIGRFKDVQDCCDFGDPVPLIYQHPQPKRDLLLPKS